MVIGETFADVDGGAELLEFFFKTFGARDAGESADEFALEPLERELFAGVEVDEVEGCVGALDDVGEGVVFADGLDEAVVAGGVTFGEENIVCAAAIAVGEDDDIAERFGEHVGLIAGETAVEEKVFSVVHDAGEGW